MTRSELIERLALEKNLSYVVAEKIILTIFDSMAETLVAGGRIEIRGFGSFDIKEFDGYTGRNPKTGELIEVKPKKLIYFKVGKDLKAMVNCSK